MWVCNTHMREALTFLETPHISKAPYQIKCSLCDNLAYAKVYYAHLTYKFTKYKLTYPSIETVHRKSG